MKQLQKILLSEAAVTHTDLETDLHRKLRSRDSYRTDTDHATRIQSDTYTA